jgi:antitoxin (DNA-binding transcriptional repressor) of toxin-antitoxin stability system
VPRTTSASQFKVKCLALLGLVAETKEILVVTKRGKPMARVVRAAQPRGVAIHVNDGDIVA